MKTNRMLSARSTLFPIVAALFLHDAAAWAGSFSTAAGDASFRRINAAGGKLSGVDLSTSTVLINGTPVLLSMIAKDATTTAQSSLSSLGQPNGAAELDSTGTLGSNVVSYKGNTVSLATITALAESAIPSSMSGAPGGVATLDSAGTLGPDIAGPSGASLLRSLASRFADTINAADYGVTCDGSTDNTAAIGRVMAAVNRSPYGAQVDWPAGQCVVSQQITATLSKNVLFRGHGPTATMFHFTGATSNGFHFYSSTAAVIEWEETGIDTTASSPVDDGLLIEGYNPGNGSLPHNNAGWIGVDHNQIEGNFWAGIHFRNLNFASASYNRITASAGPSITSAYPSPNNLTADPAASIIGSSASATAGTSVGTAGIYLEGSGSDYLIDPKVVGNSIVNGTAQIEMDDTQGGYMAANSLFNGIYGVRTMCASTASCENFTFTTGYVYDFLDDFYLEGMDGFQIDSNFLWVSGASSSFPVGGTVGVFVRNGDGGTVSGNTIQAPAPGSAPSIQQWGWFVANDNTSSKPWIMGPNSLFGGGGPIFIGNDGNTQGLMASGNDITQASQPASGSSIADATMTPTNPFGSNHYALNATPYGDASTDGQGDWYFRRSLSCGGSYDTCAITQTTNGTKVFTSDASGNLASTGQTQRYTGTGYREYTSLVDGTVASGSALQLTPGGAYPPFGSTTASAAAASGATTLSVGNGALFIAGMGLKDMSTGATATVTSVSSNTLTLSAGVTGAVKSGDTIDNVLPTSAELGLGTLNANNGTMTDREGYCVSGSTRFAVDITQLFGGYATVGATTVNVLVGTLPSGLSFSAGRDGNTGTPYLMLTNSSGASYTCRFDETFASSPL